MADYAIGEYRMAIIGFQQVLDEWPKSEQADDAQFYIGYSYMQQKKYPEAVKAFSDVIANYPMGDKVPDAYVDLGHGAACARPDRSRSCGVGGGE